MTVFASSSKYDSALLSIGGYEGSIKATRTLSADHRAITVQASAPVLANRDYTCVNSISLLDIPTRTSTATSTCDLPYCSDYSTDTTDDTDAFSIDAATPAFPTPEPEATATPTPTPHGHCHTDWSWSLRRGAARAP